MRLRGIISTLALPIALILAGPLAAADTMDNGTLGPYCGLVDHEVQFTLTASGIELPGWSFCHFLETPGAGGAYRGDVGCEIALTTDGAEAGPGPSDQARTTRYLVLEPDPNRGTIRFQLGANAVAETMHCHAVWPI